MYHRVALGRPDDPEPLAQVKGDVCIFDLLW